MANTDLSQILTDLALVEQNAMSADREARVREAIDLYYQVVQQLEYGLSLCPYNHPDTAALERHLSEVQTRISYLASLSGSARPVIPLETHIHSVELSTPVSPSHSRPSSGATMGTAAALGGVGGLLLLGPLGLVAGAAGAAYAATRSDNVGTVTREAARGTISAVDKVTTVNREHGITEKAKEMGSAAISKASEINEKYEVTATVKHVGTEAFKRLSTFNEEYKVTDKISSGLAAGFSTISNFWLPASQPSPPPPHQQYSNFQ